MSLQREDLNQKKNDLKQKVDLDTKQTSKVIKDTELSRKRSLERLGSSENGVKLAQTNIEELKTKLNKKGDKERGKVLKVQERASILSQLVRKESISDTKHSQIGAVASQIMLSTERGRKKQLK